MVTNGKVLFCAEVALWVELSTLLWCGKAATYPSFYSCLPAFPCVFAPEVWTKREPTGSCPSHCSAETVRCLWELSKTDWLWKQTRLCWKKKKKKIGSRPKSIRWLSRPAMWCWNKHLWELYLNVQWSAVGSACLVMRGRGGACRQSLHSQGYRTQKMAYNDVR